MRKQLILKIFIFMALFFIQQNLKAQKKLQYIAYAGANISNLNPQELSKTEAFGDTYKWTPSYNFGANIDLIIGKKIYFESGLNIISKKTNSLPKQIQSVRGSDFSNGIISYYYRNLYSEFNYKSVAFQIPLSIHFIVFEKNNFKINIYGGILWENMFSNKLTTITSIEYLPNTPPKRALDEIEAYGQKVSPTKSTSTINGYPFSKYNIGSLFGVGCGYKKIGIDIGMNSPIRNHTSVQYKNPSITFNVRYQIK